MSAVSSIISNIRRLLGIKQPSNLYKGSTKSNTRVATGKGYPKLVKCVTCKGEDSTTLLAVLDHKFIRCYQCTECHSRNPLTRVGKTKGYLYGA